ncbi:ABC transporter permease [Terriglobus albidus]|uniref:ABC transporter permease n=1 Tax=Terriglobus albidus TaxID=1592106 RepID=A0A5B9E8K8_9BACT|nr:ABC transporter permease [Terriglobus albidus]QEE26920.1 ABC transporter permease [Terriglobus albidus]
MSAAGRWMNRLLFLFRRSKFEAELREEMEFHREQIEEELRSDGTAGTEAHRRAAVQFGNTTRLRERSHDVVAFRWETVVQDIRYAVRQMTHSPGFAITAILMLALGIGASVTIFAFVDAALLQPLPYAQPDRLMDVTESLALFPRGNLSYQDYLDWKRLNTVFTSLEIYNGSGYLLQTAEGTEAVPGVRVSAGFFHTLGVVPVEGRDFRPGEDAVSEAPVGLLSYATWQKRFGGRRDMIGETLKLSGVPTTIIGVLPPDFQFAPRGSAEIFTTAQPTNGCEKRRSCHNLYGIGRLKDGVTVATALAEMKGIAQQLERQYPDSNRGQSASVMPLARAITGDVRPILFVLLGGAALLLLIACVNVSNLLLVRAEKRRQEMAVRGALGASRVRLARQYVTEGLVLVLLGTAAGMAVATVMMRVLHAMISKQMLAGMPYLQGMGLTAHVWGFTVTVALLAAGLFSIAPILRLPMAALRQSLSDGGRSGGSTFWRRLGANLVIVEVAIAVVLLSGAGLLSKSLWKMLHVDLGFESDHIATLSVDLPARGFEKDTQRAQFAQSLLDRIQSLPGVQSVGLTTTLPVSCNCNTDWVRFVGKPYNGIHNEVDNREVSAAFFQTLRAKLVRGRLFTQSDDATHPKVVLVNESLAKKYFPGEDPIGKKIGDTELTPNSLREIIGVVSDIKDSALDAEEWPAEYEAFAQDPSSYFSVLVRTSPRPESMLPALSAAVRALNPEVGVEDQTTLEQRIHDSPSAWLHRSAAWLMGGFAGIAFLLSMIGLYGTISYSVSQRKREIGVRMALGAQRSTIHGMILREAGRLSCFGIVAGVGCSIAAANLMGSLLFGVRTWDVATLAAVVVLLAAASLLACYLPSRRAATVNPVEALRAE